MRIDNKFNIGDHVYIITDPDQMMGIITAIILSSKDIIYQVSRDSVTERFFDFELSYDKDQLMTL